MAAKHEPSSRLYISVFGQDGAGVLLGVYTSALDEKNMQASLQTILKRNNINIRTPLANINQSVQREVLRYFLYACRCDLFLQASVAFKDQKLAGMLEGLARSLQTRKIRPEAIQVQVPSSMVNKTRSLLKKKLAGIPANFQEDSVILDAMQIFLYTAMSGSRLWQDNASRISMPIAETAFWKEAFDAATQKRLQTRFSTLPSLLDPSAAWFLKPGLQNQQAGRLLDLLEGELSLETVQEILPLKTRGQAFDAGLDLLEAMEHADAGFDWSQAFGAADLEAARDYFQKRLYSLMAGMVYAHSRDTQILTAIDPNLEAQSRALCQSLFLQWLAWLGEGSQQEKEAESTGRTRGKQVFLLERDGKVLVLSIPTASEKGLRKALTALFLSHGQDWRTSLSFVSVSPASAHLYEELAALFARKGLEWQIFPASTDLPAKLTEHFASSTPASFHAASPLAQQLKASLLQSNRAGYVQVEEGEGIARLLGLFLDAWSYYHSNTSAVEARMRPGKDRFSWLLWHENPWTKDTYTGKVQPYFPDQIPLSDAYGQLLSWPYISFSLTRRLKEAANKGLKAGTGFYVLETEPDLELAKRRLRDIVLPYLYTSAGKRFLEGCLMDPRLSCDMLDVLMQPGYSLSKRKRIARAFEEGLDVKEVAWAINPGMSLTKLDAVLSALRPHAKRAGIPYDLWLEILGEKPAFEEDLAISLANAKAQKDHEAGILQHTAQLEAVKEAYLQAAADHLQTALRREISFFAQPQIVQLLQNACRKIPA